jgi:hypothetical protein
MKTFHRIRRRSLAVTVLAFIVALVPLVALASDLNVTSVVDADTAESSIELAPGSNQNITIDMSVTGRQDHPATFEVNRNWELQADGSFTGSNPESHNVAPRAASDPATLFTSNGNVSVAAGVPADTYLLTIAPVVTSTSAPAALGVGALATLTIIVDSGADPVVEIHGFYEPVATGDNVVNEIRGNRGLPFKFNVFIDGTEVTDPSEVSVKGWTPSGVCNGATASEAPATNTMGNTALRYDYDAGQFIKNVSTANIGRGCWAFTIEVGDESTTAYFNKR